jgi:hypothetical protein
LRLVRAGDYTFAIPGPIADVRRAQGSDSEPGLRRDAIVWAGFSPGNRLLAARATLRVGAAASALPVRLLLSQTAGEVRLRVRNATAVRIQAFTGPAGPESAAEQLDAARAAARQGSPVTDAYVEMRGQPRSVLVDAYAPLELTGELRFPPGTLEAAQIEGGRREGDTVVFRARLGDQSPLELAVAVRGVDAVPRVRLVAVPVPPLDMLRPSGASWAAAVRRGDANGARLLARLVRARLAAARADQYQRYLASPDPRGRTRAAYVYETAARRAVPAPPEPATEEGGAGVLTTVLLIAVGLVGLGGLAVWWARS